MAHYKGAASEAGRAMQLLKKREQAQMEIEFRKKKIEEDLKISNIENKFAAHYDAVEQQLKTSTIGLVTLDEMKAKQENIVKERERKLAQKQAEKEREQQRQLEAKQAEKNRQKKMNFKMRSDSDDDSEEGPSSAQAPRKRNKSEKGRPQEVSSKMFPKRNLPKPQKRIDPRFDSLCGEFDERTFKASYGFIDQIQQKERKALQKKFKNTKNPQRKNEIKYLLDRISNQEEAKKKKELRKKQVQEILEKDAAPDQGGQQKQFLRKKETRMLDLLNDFEDLDKKGKLMKYLDKKSKKFKKRNSEPF